MASPHVAGAAALLLQSDPTATPAQIAALIVNSATPDAITGLAAGDQDNDAHLGPVQFITAEQKDELIRLMRETGADTAAFLKYMGLESLDEMPAGMFPNAIKAINKKRKGA